MIPKPLRALQNEDFDLRYMCIATTGALHLALNTCDEVRAIREALGQGAITDAIIKAHVSSLVVGFRTGQPFRNDLALAAIAVALEKRATDFAEGFLHELARLELAEMRKSIRVARYCLLRRYALAKNKAKKLDLTDPFLVEKKIWGMENVIVATTIGTNSRRPVTRKDTKFASTKW